MPAKPGFGDPYLVTTVNDEADRISMHGVRTELLIQQAESIDIPLYQIRLPEMPDMATYDKVMTTHLIHFKNEGITHAIFGDIFLEDLRNYRDKRLIEVGMTGIYPLWKRNTTNLINEFLSLGFGTVIACVQHYLEGIIGEEVTPELIKNLPKIVNPCGENGEFHTFTFKGPIFKNEIKYRTGKKVLKEYKAHKKSDDMFGESTDKIMSGFWYYDLLPA